MSTSNLERLIGKLRSMHLATPRAFGHFYHLQMALTAFHHAIQYTSYLSKCFHRDVKFWKSLSVDMGSCITYLTVILQCLTTNVGYTNSSGLGCGGVWIDPSKDDIHYIWRLHWPEDVKADLVSYDNTQRRIITSDLELAALVLQEATFRFVRTNPTWQAPFTESNNTPTVAWKFGKLST